MLSLLSEIDWNPDILDSEVEDMDAWDLDNTENEELDPDSLFNHHGELIRRCAFAQRNFDALNDNLVMATTRNPDACLYHTNNLETTKARIVQPKVFCLKHQIMHNFANTWDGFRRTV